MTDGDPIKALRDMLDRVAAVKMPTSIRRGDPDPADPENEEKRVALQPREKIARLESYLLLTAEARQMAHQAEIAASDALFECDRKMREGWQSYLTGSASKATGPQIAEAKRQAFPEEYDRRGRLEWLTKQFAKQIRRLEQDDEVASRVYTLIAGS